MFGSLENERKRKEKRENGNKKQGLSKRCVKSIVRLQYVHNMAYIASQICEKYQTNLNNMITLRAKEELNKTESFGSLNRE